MERYRATILAITNLDKPIKRQECPGENSYIITDKQVILVNIIDIKTNQIVLRRASLKVTKRINQVSQLIYPGNMIDFDATIENGNIIRTSNICGENGIGHDSKNNWQPFKLPRTPGPVGCLYCKHYDCVKERHKKTCYKLNTWSC